MEELNAIEYFTQRRPISGPMRVIYSRIITALRLRNIVTMDQLCEMSVKELDRMRGIGEKAREVILDECRQYKSESNRGEEQSRDAR